jgi:hypothetical protein
MRYVLELSAALAGRQVQDVGGIVERLLGFLEMGRSFVTAEAVIQLKDLLRRYPAIAEASLSSISAISPEVQRPAQMCPNFRYSVHVIQRPRGT